MYQESNLWSELELLAKENSSNALLDKYVKSELPNEFFLKQFTCIGERPFCEKKYWIAFAKVLINRGVEQTANVQAIMLIWLQDINWPACDLIWQFVLSNITAFHGAIKECILKSITTNDEAWLNALLSLVFTSQGFSDFEIARKLSISEELLQSKDTIETLSVKVDSIINLKT